MGPPPILCPVIWCGPRSSPTLQGGGLAGAQSTTRVAGGGSRARGRQGEGGMGERAFPFIRTNERQGKPRARGVTEIRGPYYTPMGKRYLEDVLETMGAYVDSLKFAGGAFALMPRAALAEIVEVAHRHDVLVSTGGFVERVLVQGPEAVDQYIRECRDLGFDIVELSSGFITLPTDDWLRLVAKVQEAGLKAKPEIGIQFGAGGASAAEALEAEGTRDVEW